MVCTDRGVFIIVHLKMYESADIPLAIQPTRTHNIPDIQMMMRRMLKIDGSSEFVHWARTVGVFKDLIRNKP